MKVDVVSDIVINRPVEEVYAYAGDPSNAPSWYANIKTVEWKTSPAVATGSKVEFVAEFLGRRLQYTYELVDVVPRHRLVMRTEEGPFPMETTYTWESGSNGSTYMTLRNRGEPSGFSNLAVPALVVMMRRAMRKDLARLKSVLELSQGR